jgi:polysaccharide biosynthesis/export protein
MFDTRFLVLTIRNLLTTTLVRAIILSVVGLGSLTAQIGNFLQQRSVLTGSNPEQPLSNSAYDGCESGGGLEQTCSTPPLSLDNRSAPMPGFVKPKPYQLESAASLPDNSLGQSQPFQRSILERAPLYPAEQPTEFQRYVESSVGKLLPVFGASLFNSAPSTFAPAENIPVTADYVVRPGDELEIRIWGQINFSKRTIVDPNGNIYIPQVGLISVNGLKAGQLNEATKVAVGHLYKNFELDVTLGQLRSIQIFVLGFARQPGSYTVSSLSTLVNALVACGGPSARGSLRHIELKRENKLVSDFDLYDLLLYGDKSKDVPVLSGDVLYIPPVGDQIAITGSVAAPAIYEIKSQTTITAALALTGGATPVAAMQKFLLDRVNNHSSLKAEEISLDENGRSTLLQNGDIVRLLPVVPQFGETVSVRGNVADSVRMPWHQGMRVSDLIPSKESLLTRDFWRERNKLISVSEQETTELKRQVSAETTGPQLNIRDQTRNLSSDKSLGASLASTETVRSFTAVNKVQAPAPDVNWSYAVIERIDRSTLSTRLIPFNLEQAVIHHESAQDILLEPGDIVTVLSSSDVSVATDQQSKYVRIEGEVAAAGVYTIHPGETLRQAIALAGGLTPKAYLFGAEFTRESTRREQQKQLHQFVDSMEQDLNQSAANLQGKALSAQEATTNQMAIATQRQTLQKVRDIAATGRIVLELSPLSSQINDLPDLPLENGDRLFIPARPLTVNVVGMVYNQTSLLYGDNLRLGEYLKQSGGPSRYADRARMFVVRADGSVVTRALGSGLFAKNLADLRMYPGDTVVVPAYVNKATFLRGLIDWTQVFSNVGLGAAAINVLR